MKRLFWVVLLVAGLMPGCGSGSAAGPGSLPITITLGPSGTQNAVAGQPVNVTATVANDTKGVTWSLSPATGAGALSAQTATSVT